MNITKKSLMASPSSRMAVIAITLLLSLFVVIPVLFSACVNYVPLAYAILTELFLPQPGHKPVGFAIFWMIAGTVTVLSCFVDEKSKWRILVVCAIAIMGILGFAITPGPMTTIPAHIDFSTVFGWQLLMACFAYCAVGVVVIGRMVVKAVEFFEWLF